MIKIKTFHDLGRTDLDWLDSMHHFSFGEYKSEEYKDFGPLKVLNDDSVQPGTGFGLHPHTNMEIISYIVEGELTHKDDLGNESTIKRGQFQYMSAGKGISHSEYNNDSRNLRFIQLWIEPNTKNTTPEYQELKFDLALRENKIAHIAGNNDSSAPIKIKQDCDIYITNLEQGKHVTLDDSDQYSYYVVQLEGESIINNQELKSEQAAQVENEKIINIVNEQNEQAHILIVKVSK